VAAMEVTAAVFLPSGRREDTSSPLLYASSSSASQSRMCRGDGGAPADSALLPCRDGGGAPSDISGGGSHIQVNGELDEEVPVAGGRRREALYLPLDLAVVWWKGGSGAPLLRPCSGAAPLRSLQGREGIAGAGAPPEVGVRSLRLHLLRPAFGPDDDSDRGSTSSSGGREPEPKGRSPPLVVLELGAGSAQRQGHDRRASRSEESRGGAGRAGGARR
jgi:hypothetical protein